MHRHAAVCLECTKFASYCLCFNVFLNSKMIATCYKIKPFSAACIASIQQAMHAGSLKPALLSPGLYSQ